MGEPPPPRSSTTPAMSLSTVAGDLYIPDSDNNRVQEVAAATGTHWGQSMTANDIYTVAGSSSGTSGNSGDGGAATSAKLYIPAFMNIDPYGNLIVDDIGRLRRSGGRFEFRLRDRLGHHAVGLHPGRCQDHWSDDDIVYTHTVGSDTSVTLSYSSAAPKVASLAVYSGINTTSRSTSTTCRHQQRDHA